MYSRIVIHATNIHQGGGRSLFLPLLKILPKDTVIFVDERMLLPSDMACDIEIIRVKPSILHRLLAEKWLSRVVKKNDVVLCFGNLPPLIKLTGHTVVFVQNRYLIDDVSLRGFPLAVQLRLAIERMWLSGSKCNVDEFVVQTPTMQKLLEQKTLGRYPIRVLPFVSISHGYVRRLMQSNLQYQHNHDFVYVASGEPHKNHLRLIDAWCLLAEEGFFPTLCLTLSESRFSGLCQDIDMMRQRYGLKVSNLGELSHSDVLRLYQNAWAAIYPSTFESFGLPLIEARQAGLPVLASELDYVRDVLDPEQTFDPISPVSIARAVKRFIDEDEQPLPLLDASQFLASIFEGAS